MKKRMKGHVKTLYDLFVKHGELTDLDLASYAPQINPNSIRGTRLRLQEMKIIESAGEKKYMGTSPNVKSKSNKAGYFTVYKLRESHKPKKEKKLKVDSGSSAVHEACVKVMHSLMELIKIVAKNAN